MSIVLDGTSGVIVSGNTNTLSGVTVGRGAGSVSTNTAVGAGALAANTTGGANTTIGYQAGKSNTTANEITAVGYNALTLNSTGQFNSAVGAYCLDSNTTGTYNTAVGDSALHSNTTASNNTAVGYQAGYNSSTGDLNTYIGYQAAYSGTSSFQNVAIGRQTLFSNSTAANNIAIGNQAGYGITSYGNVAIGTQTQYASASGVYNTTVGYSAGNVITGSKNAFYGFNAGSSVTTGSNNTIIGGYNGNQGGLDIRTANNYIVLSDGDGNPKAFIDDQANSRLKLVGTGVNNAGVVVGLGSTLTEYGYLSLGTSYGVASSKDVALGLSTTAGARVYVQNRSAGVYLADGGTSWTSNSDERLKTELVPFENATAKVASIRTGTGRYLTDEETISRSFLIAQDVQAVLPEAVDVAKDEQGTLGVAYTDLIPLLIASIKELNAKVDAQAAEIAALKGTA